MGSHIGNPKAMGPVNLLRFWGEFHSVAKQASFYIAFATELRGFWKPYWTLKFDFKAFFFDVMFGSFFTSKFGRFSEAQNQTFYEVLKHPVQY